MLAITRSLHDEGQWTLTGYHRRISKSPRSRPDLRGVQRNDVPAPYPYLPLDHAELPRPSIGAAGSASRSGQLREKAG